MTESDSREAATGDIGAWPPEGFSFVEPLEGVACLRAILNGSRVGEVAGVQFDFRHPSIPSSDTWHSPNGSSPFGIVFPWDRELFDGDNEAAE